MSSLDLAIRESLGSPTVSPAYVLGHAFPADGVRVAPYVRERQRTAVFAISKS